MSLHSLKPRLQAKWLLPKKLFVFLALSLIATASFAALRPPAHAYDATAFVMRVRTDNPGTSPDTQFTIPTIQARDYPLTEVLACHGRYMVGALYSFCAE